MASEAGDRRRAVITGLGAVSAWGWGVPALHAGLRSGRTAIGPFQRFDHTRHRTHVAGEVPPGPPPEFDRGPALAAPQPGRPLRGLRGPRGRWPRPAWRGRSASAAAGVYFGSSTGGMLESERYFTELVRHGRAAPTSA